MLKFITILLVGGIAGTVIHFLLLKYIRQKFITIPVAAIIVVSGVWLYSAMESEQIKKSNHEKLRAETITRLKKVPVYLAIHDHDPEEFETIIRQYMEFEHKKNPQKLIEFANKMSSRYIAKYVPRTSDRALKRYLRSMIQNHRGLLKIDPLLCVQQINPGVFGMPQKIYTDVLDKKYIQEFDDAIYHLVKDALKSPHEPFIQSINMAMLGEVNKSFHSRYPEKDRSLSRPMEAKFEKNFSGYCKNFISYYTFILNQGGSGLLALRGQYHQWSLQF